MTRAESSNVIGLVLERTRPDEYIIFTAQWDHLGVAKRGVPALFVRGGVEHREMGRDYGLAYNRA